MVIFPHANVLLMMLEITQIKWISTANSGQAGRERLHVKMPTVDPGIHEDVSDAADGSSGFISPPVSRARHGRDCLTCPSCSLIRAHCPCTPPLSPRKQLAAAKPDVGSVHCPKHPSSESVN